MLIVPQNQEYRLKHHLHTLKQDWLSLRIERYMNTQGIICQKTLVSVSNQQQHELDLKNPAGGQFPIREPQLFLFH
jgi:hypothetical protein